MLCFLFAALIVAFDQFFKQWVVRTIDIGGTGPEIIPGVMGLTRWENDGAMLNILSGQQWLLAGIAFVAAIVLIMILLRYNEGFWGTIGLAAVLGGTIGNLADRVFNDGKVVDMFKTLFIDFPIFNIADIFITLGFLTFLIHFIALSFKGGQKEKEGFEYPEGYDSDYDEPAYDEFPDVDGADASQSRTGAEDSYVTASSKQAPSPQYDSEPQYKEPASYTEKTEYVEQVSSAAEPQYEQEDYSAAETDITMPDDYSPITDSTLDTSITLDELEAELGSLDEYSVDDLLREYGFDDDESI